MPFIPKVKTDIVPRTHVNRSSPINYDLLFLHYGGDTTNGNYYFQNGVSANTLTANTFTTTGVTTNVFSGNSISGGTYYSGSTPIWNIIYDSKTILRNGLNTFTGGTYGNYNVNVSALTINTLTTSGATRFTQASATTFSASTYYSGSTNLQSIIVTNGQNLATPNNIFKQRSGNNLQFRNLIAGSNISLSEAANSITIANTYSYTPPQRDLICTDSNVASEYYAERYDYIVAIDTSTGSITVYLYGTPEAGQEIIIKDRTGYCSGNNILIEGNGYNIDGSTTYTMQYDWQSICLHFIDCCEPPLWIVTRDYVPVVGG